MRHTTAFAEWIPIHTRSSNLANCSTTHDYESWKISSFDSYHDSFNRVRFLQTLQFYLCEQNGAILASHSKLIFTEHSCVSPRPRLQTPEYNSNHMKWVCDVSMWFGQKCNRMEKQWQCAFPKPLFSLGFHQRKSHKRRENKIWKSAFNGCAISINHDSIFHTKIIPPSTSSPTINEKYVQWIRMDIAAAAAAAKCNKEMSTYLVGTKSLPSTTNSHDVILIGHAIWPKLSRTRVSHDEYGVCESECNRSERCKRARRLGDAVDMGDVDAFIWSICQRWARSLELQILCVSMPKLHRI